MRRFVRLFILVCKCGPFLLYKIVGDFNRERAIKNIQASLYLCSQNTSRNISSKIIAWVYTLTFFEDIFLFYTVNSVVCNIADWRITSNVNK